MSAVGSVRVTCRGSRRCLSLTTRTTLSLVHRLGGRAIMIRRLILTLLVLVVAARAARAEDANDPKKNGEIRLPLKEFKFKVPEDKAELFVFDEDGQRLCFYTNGVAEAKFTVENDGDYDLVLSLAGDSAMNVRPKFKLAMDDKDVGKETSLKSDDIKDYKVE